jgi:agmatine deiminase
MVRIGLVQMRVSPDPDKNLDLAIAGVRVAASRGAVIVCLPELFRSLYFPQYRSHSRSADAAPYAEALHGKTVLEVSRVAQELKITVIVPIYERGQDGKFFNTAVVVGENGPVHPPYRKVHIPHDPLFYEKDYFTPGEEYRVYQTDHATFSVLICYDQWFPEAARTVALMGADLIFYPTAIGWIRGEEETCEGDWAGAWEAVQLGHAIANSVYVAPVNRVGREDGLLFFGNSFVADPFGAVIARAGREDEVVIVADLDMEVPSRTREGWGFFRNRRPETYHTLTGKGRALDSGGGAVLCTPAARGYRMPAEWERHDAVWLAWPHDKETFPDIFGVRETFIAIILALHQSETVHLLVQDDQIAGDVAARIQRDGGDPSRVVLHITKYADVWFRDYGPTFLVGGEGPGVAMVQWDFNAWGGKYETLAADREVPSLLHHILKVPVFSPGIVLEGGSIDVNGRGTVLTTEQCLLNRNRNPHISRDAIEHYLMAYLGVRKVIWLGEGIEGDDTDGHIDDIARFVDERTVVCSRSDDIVSRTTQCWRRTLHACLLPQIRTDCHLPLLRSLSRGVWAGITPSLRVTRTSISETKSSLSQPSVTQWMHAHSLHSNLSSQTGMSGVSTAGQ